MHDKLKWNYKWIGRSAKYW